MKEIIMQIFGISVLLAIPLSTLAMGIDFGKAYLKEIFKEKQLLIRYTLAMFVIIPALALLLVYLDVQYRSIWAGLFLVSISPAMPAIVNTSKKLNGDTSLSLSWFVTSLILSLIFIPISILIAEQVMGMDLNVGLLQVFLKIFLFFILPLIIGFLIKNFLPGHSDKIKKVIGLISKVAMLVLVIILAIIAIPLIIKQGLIPNLLIIAFQVVVLIVGLFFGKPEAGRGFVLASSMVLRFPAAAIIIAQINGTIEKHAPVIIGYMIFGFIVIKIAGKFISKNSVQNKK